MVKSRRMKWAQQIALMDEKVMYTGFQWEIHKDLLG
jgi:hypothetical protein